MRAPPPICLSVCDITHTHRRAGQIFGIGPATMRAPPSAGLVLQAAWIDEALDLPVFRDAVLSIRSCALSHAPFTPPLPKQPSVFQQQSPVGHTRIVAEPDGFEPHIQAAVDNAAVPRRDPWKLASADVAAAVSFVAAHSADTCALHAKRLHVTATMEQVADSLRPLSLWLVQFAPAHVRTLPTAVHVPLVAAVVAAIDWPDKLLHAKLMFGSPVVGDLPASGLFRPKERPAVKPAPSFDRRAWVDELERRMHRRGRRSTHKSAKFDDLALSKSYDEAKAGWADGPFSKEEMYRRYPDGFWPSRRFGVLQKGAIRPCDDCRESELNDHSTTHEGVVSDGAEFPATLADLFYSLLGPSTELAGGCDDWKKAYRQIPVDDTSCSVVAAWDPAAKAVRYFITKGHCFGAVAAVNSFNALAHFLTGASRRLYGACCGNYFDDHVFVEPTYAGCSAQDGLLSLARLMGFLFDLDEKHQPMMREFVYLGVVNDLHHTAEGKVLLKVLPARREALVQACGDFLKAGRMSPAEASSLRGKLFFAATTAYGRVGRAALQPFIQRQWSRSKSNRMTQPLILSLRFFITLLNNMPDREITLSPCSRPPVLVWSDASWEKMVGWLGFVVYDPEQARFFYSDSEVPPHILSLFVQKKQKIGQCEILAASMVYTSMPETFRGRSVIHWIDNTSAISCLLHGYSGKADSALLVNAFHLFNAGLRANIHFEYVESKANVSDLPSRRELSYLLCTLAAKRVPTVIHPQSTWEGPIRHFIFAGMQPCHVPTRKRGSRTRGARGPRPSLSSSA